MPIDPLSASLGLIGSIYDNEQRQKGQSAANNLNRELFYAQQGFATENQKRQNAYDYKMWQRNNDYNSPYNQMQRYKDAGLSPHLMYGQGTSGNTSGPTDSTQAQNVAAPTMQNTRGQFSMGSDTAANMVSIAQTDNLKAMSDQNRQKTINLATDNLNAGEDYRSKKRTNDINDVYAKRAQEAAVQRAESEATISSNNADISTKTKDQTISIANSTAKEKAEKLKWLPTQKAILEAEKIIQQYKANLASKNLNPDDSYITRMFEKMGLDKVVQDAIQQLLRKYNIFIN